MDLTPKSGTFSDLLKEFAMRYKLGKGEAGNSERLGVLCMVLDMPRSTVEQWFRRETAPTATRTHKLQLILALCGYETDERRNMSPLTAFLRGDQREL